MSTVCHWCIGGLYIHGIKFIRHCILIPKTSVHKILKIMHQWSSFPWPWWQHLHLYWWCRYRLTFGSPFCKLLDGSHREKCFPFLLKPKLLSLLGWHVDDIFITTGKENITQAKEAFKCHFTHLHSHKWRSAKTHPPQRTSSMDNWQLCHRSACEIHKPWFLIKCCWRVSRQI